MLFDVDGTLTEPRQKITPRMTALLRTLGEMYTVAVVGGSNHSKIREQLGQDLLDELDFVFCENGLVSYKDGSSLPGESIQDYLGDEKLRFLIDSTLMALAAVKIPKKRGTFIELRKGLINISPIGRDCTQAERDEFAQYDELHNVRQSLIESLQKAYGDSYGLKFSIGGQISVDVFPFGWDKTYCLRFLSENDFDAIHFFGDKTHRGGNDHEIFEHPRTIGYHVNSSLDTLDILEKQFS
uniref:Phosphomannomutase n=1 Tax=Paramoeba aestuarina TaxID=180227 RepID=A0A7S4KW97_9EUKA